MSRAVRNSKAAFYRSTLLRPASIPCLCRRLVNQRSHQSALRPGRRLFSTQARIQAFEGLPHISVSHAVRSNVVISENGRPAIARGDRFSNTADRITDQLREDGHIIWGFAVYRCTNGDDEAWEACLERMNETIRDSMRFYNALELLEPDCFKLTVFDDKSRFDGATAQVVRQHFRDWRSAAIHQEQGSQEEIEARGGSSGPLDFKSLVRYRFCVQIDEAALPSIVSPEGEDRGGDAWVNLVEGEWVSGMADARREQRKIMQVEMGLDPEDYDDDDLVDGFPELDGCTEENVGWIRVRYMDLIPAFHSLLRDSDALQDMYVRPPELART